MAEMTYKEGPIQAVWESGSDQSPYWEVGKLYGFGPQEWTCGEIIIEKDLQATPTRILVIDHTRHVRASIPYAFATFIRMEPV